jgi:hypothetical protein
VLRVARQPALVDDSAHLGALGVDHHERHVRRLREVEAHTALVAHPVAVRREVGRLGREADHEREVALELLREEEGADSRDHENREHRAHQWLAHLGRRSVIRRRP